MINRISNCRRWRETIRLRVCGALAKELDSQLEAHLADCAECRSYSDQVHATAVGLRSLSRGPAEPSPGFRARWTSLVEEEARPKSFTEIAAIAMASWQSWLMRNLRPALGVAGLWLLTLLFRLSAPQALPPTQIAVASSPQQIVRVLEAEAKQYLLAWHFWKQIDASPTTRKPALPPPRSGLSPTRPAAQFRPDPLSQITLARMAPSCHFQRNGAAPSVPSIA